MSVPPEYECLIVGGGLVGASLACALSAEPLRIGLVEAVPFQAEAQPSYDDRGLVLAPASQRILAGLGLWQALAAEATPIKRIHISDRGHFGFTHMEAAHLGVPALGHVVVARLLGKALLSHLSSADQVDLLCPAHLERVELEPAQVRVALSQNGQHRHLTTRLLVAADGGESELRRWLGIKTDIKDYRQTAVVANVTPERVHDYTAYERFTSSGPLALLPLAGQHCVVVWGTSTEAARTLMTLADEAFLEGLTERFGRRLGRFVKAGRRRSYPLLFIRARQQTGHRFAILGNAAHTLHPNAAQGLNLGLRDVAMLAELLIQTHRCGGDIGSAGVLARYVSLRRADQCQVIRFSDTLARLFYNDFPPFVVGRDLAMLAIDLFPPLKRQLMRRAMGISGRQPRLVRGLPL
jgi:2-octaprenyl-6-methoxyphenol hydroxylase